MKNDLVALDAIKKAAKVLRAINHPLRLQLLQLLNTQEKLCVSDLYIQLREEQSVVSNHLAILREAGVVGRKQEGKFQHYYIHYDRLDRINEFANKLIKK